MPANGTPVARQYIITLRDGSIAVDWGNGLYQDVYTGAFIQLSETQISHTTTDIELDTLRFAGYVASYDSLIVALIGLPERPQKTMD